MFRLFLAAAFVASAMAECQDFSINYVLPPPLSRSTMSVSICSDDNTIESSMVGTQEFKAVNILEDYDVGFGATRVPSQEACYIHKLQYSTLAEQADYLLKHRTVPMQVEQSVELLTLPVDDASEFGSRLVDFCGDLPVYKVGINEESERAMTPIMEPESRIISLRFSNCVLICFIPVCTITDLTFPTGLTITFGWFFFG